MLVTCNRFVAVCKSVFGLSKFGEGITNDVRGRRPHYKTDWIEGCNCSFRVLAPAVYTFFTSAIPALAFGQQLAQYTNGVVTGVQVLAATAICGTLQAVVGGQPLLIVGVAEPIVLLYKFMYEFAKGRPDLGEELFLPWASWVLVWTSVMLLIVSLSGACAYIARFTRFSGELFGGLIALLFLQQAISGARDEFLPQGPVGLLSVPSSAGAGTLYVWRLVNGLWGLFLGFGLLLTSIALRKSRSSRFGWTALRSFLADYGVPLMVVAWSGLSYALRGAPPGIPRRVLIPNTWDATSNWYVVKDMGSVGSVYIAAALVPALIITVLFFFDHNVSAQMAQLEEFHLEKPPAYHYDLALLALMTLLCGLLGLPPVNGVLPQAPMHTQSLITLRAQNEAAAERKSRKFKLSNLNVPAVSSGTANSDCAEGSEPVPAVLSSTPRENGNSDKLTRESPSEPYHQRAQEQRVTGLLQSLMVGACLGITPAIKWIPTAVLWGYFAYMALESLPGSQFWDRLLLLITDPGIRSRMKPSVQAPYAGTVDFEIVAAFTACQLIFMLGVWGITWAGIAGVVFPIPIMLLVPIRQYIMPRVFPKASLAVLDPLSTGGEGPESCQTDSPVAHDSGMDPTENSRPAENMA